MTGPNFGRALTALACWRAGSRHGVLGMLAVACVLRNQGGNPYTRALLLPEMAMGWDLDGHDLYPDEREPEFLTLLANLDTVLEGRTKDLTCGGLRYSHAGEPPAHGERVASVPGMTFYK